MTRMSKSKQLARCRSRLEHAQKWREDEGYDATWLRMKDLYRGRHFADGASDEDRIKVNIAFSTVNVIFPSITVNHPKIEIMANKPEDEDRAVIAEAVVNYWWRHYDFRTPFRRAAKDFVTIGHGWIKVGYRFKEAEVGLNGEEVDRSIDELIAEADQFAAERPELAGALPSDEEIAANVPESKIVVKEDRPFIERISFLDMFVDPEGTCMDDLGWIAQRIIRPLDEVKADERYKSGARSRIKADAAVRADWLDESERRKRDSDADRVTIWEFYDLRANTVCTFAEGCDEFLIDPMPIPYAGGHPYEFLGNYDVPDEFYPVGDLEQIEDPQQELNKTRSQMMNHRKKYSRKYLYRASALSPEGRDGLESSEDNVAIEVIDDNIQLTDVIAPVPITPMSSDLYQYSDIITGDMNTVSGINEYARGATPETRRTATEAAIIQDAANARAADKLAIIEVAIGRVARKVLQLAQQYMSTEQVARVVGPDQAMIWVPFNYDDISGEFDFTVEGGSTQPNNDTFRRQQALALMNALGPLIGTVIDPGAIAQHVLQTGFGIKNPSKFMMAAPPPMMGPDGQPMDPSMVPPGAVGAQGGEGMDAPQPDPRDLEAMKQEAAMAQAMGGQAGPQGMAAPGSGGIPPELLAQLMAQTGLG